MLDGNKTWFKQEKLCNFGEKSCLLSVNEAQSIYKQCLDATKKIIIELEIYMQTHPDFRTIGERMCSSFRESL